MKQIPKKQFDELIRFSREFWKSNPAEANMQNRIALGFAIREKTGIDWLAVIDLIDSIIRSTGFLPGASNEKIYEVLNVLGWEVVEDVEVNTSE